MVRKADKRADAAVSITAENWSSPDSGTALANYSPTPSCHLAQPCKSQRGTWGGARNRADRVSHYLSDKQVAGLIEASRRAFATGRVFQRHWTVHYGLAGIQAEDAMRFISKLLDLVSKQARREGGKLSAIWVRECASGKGEHVHILLHLPDGMSLRNRTRRWVEAAGGTYRRGVSKVTIIGARLTKVTESSGAVPLANAENVLRYVLKASSSSVGRRLGLTRRCHNNWIVGKRCGQTQNLGNQ